MSIIVHHLEKSRSHRILWLLEELGAPYEVKEYKRDPKTQLAPRELKEIHALGKSPVITEGEVVVAESAVIMEYLLDRFDEKGLRPEGGTEEFLRYRYWMHYAEGSAMSPLLLKVVFDQLPRQSPLLVKPLLAGVNKAVSKEYINPEIRLHMDYWEKELGERTYFAGESFTAADIQMSFAMEGGLAAMGAKRYPKIGAHLERVKGREAFARAEERGGAFDLDFG